MSKFDFKISDEDLFPKREAKEDLDLSERPTVKMVLTDMDDNICLIAKTGSGFYFLPGGGIEEGEDKIDALKRECLEEAGCDIAIEGEIGTVTEFRNEVGEKRTVSCYRGRVAGEKGVPTLAAEDEGFDVIWLGVHDAITKLEDQLAAISAQTPNFYARKFNSARDLRVLQQVSWLGMAQIQE